MKRDIRKFLISGRIRICTCQPPKYWPVSDLNDLDDKIITNLPDVRSYPVSYLPENLLQRLPNSGMLTRNGTKCRLGVSGLQISYSKKYMIFVTIITINYLIKGERSCHLIWKKIYIFYLVIVTFDSKTYSFWLKSTWYYELSGNRKSGKKVT